MQFMDTERLHQSFTFPTSNLWELGTRMSIIGGLCNDYNKGRMPAQMNIKPLTDV